MKEQNLTLLITKNQNTTNLKEPNSTQYNDWPDTSGDTSWKSSFLKSKLGKSSNKLFLWWILMALKRSLVLIVTVPSLL